MNVPIEKQPKSLVIFDKFYRNPSASPLQDSLSEVVDDERYNILANAYNLAAAVSLLIDIKDGTLETPDVIITGGFLKGEFDYVNDPQVIAQTTTRMVRGLRGKREKTDVSDHQLLPTVNENGEVYLPTAYPNGSGANKLNTLRFMDSWAEHGAGTNLSAFVLCHLANELIGDKGIKVIGHASNPFASHLPIDAFVKKGEFGSTFWLNEDIEPSASSSEVN